MLKENCLSLWKKEIKKIDKIMINWQFTIFYITTLQFLVLLF